ncbi:TRIM3 [Branchiostoma lanceolatum]|uniref:TRIM3 protein n=1 Tax=Branchiostoma lanceolatum TaxID=7740 RepID=A0A8K0EY46_BRALA|nr:TRIM3 [Branchiostoma lanceolatum]
MPRPISRQLAGLAFSNTTQRRKRILRSAPDRVRPEGEMAEAPADEVPQTQTANSQIAADLIDPGGSTRQENGETPMSSPQEDSEAPPPLPPKKSRRRHEQITGTKPGSSGQTPARKARSRRPEEESVRWSRPPGQTPGEPSTSRHPERIPREPSRPPAQTPAAREPSRPPAQTPAAREPSRPPAQTPAAREPSRPPAQTPAAREPSRPPGQTPAAREPSRPPAQTPAARFPLPKQRDAKGAGVYRHRLREEDLVNLPLNPMYGADLPSADGQGQGQDAAQARGSEDGQPSGPTTHTYEDGDTFGMRLGQPLNRDARSAPTVPSTPRPGRSTDGAQPVAAATHVYADGESVGMRLGPGLNSDVLGAPPVPSTPRPGRPTGGVQQGPAGPNPLLNPQAILSQLRPNPMYNSNQPPGSAQESRTVWGQLRHRLSPRQLICAAISSVTLVTLLIVVPVPLTHLHSRPWDQDSPATTTAGPSITGRAAWKSSAVLMRTDEVTSADVTKVSPVHGCGPSHGITAAGPTPINTPVSTNTEAETSDQGRREHVITFGDESGAGKLRSVRGVAVSPDSMIWVADRSTAHLHVYSMEGVYLHQFPQDAPGLGHPSKRPSDVSIDKDGHLWILMLGYPASPDSVVQFTRDGNLKANFDLPDTVPRGLLRGMAVDLCNNHVFVTWSVGYRGGLQAFSPDGKLQWGVGPQQQMRSPMNVAVNGEGNIFVSDSFTHTIYKYDETGQYVSKFGGSHLGYPEGICVDNSGHIIVVNSYNQRVVMYTGGGRYVRHIPVRAEHPTRVAVGPGGQLVVTSSGTITVFPRY